MYMHTMHHCTEYHMPTYKRCSCRTTMQCVMEHLINIVSQDVAAIPQSTKIELSGLYLSLKTLVKSGIFDDL